MKTEDQYEEALQVSEDILKVTPLNSYYYHLAKKIMNQYGNRMHNEYPENYSRLVRYVEAYNGQS